jgi:hypothetical protein
MHAKLDDVSEQSLVASYAASRTTMVVAHSKISSSSKLSWQLSQSFGAMGEHRPKVDQVAQAKT